MINVTAAILIKDGLILIAKRRASDTLSNKWEFPGGKIEVGESAEDCLVRELKEEFDINTDIEKYFGKSIYQYTDFKIKLIVYKVKWISGRIRSTSHDLYEWIKIDDIDNYDFAEADKPLVKKLKKEML